MTPLNLQGQVDKSWTLFLDRDGVINVESVGSYITKWEDFQFYDGVPQVLRSLSEVFGTIVIVTNQRGVGRGIMSVESLKDINTNLKAAVSANGGKIDKIYCCTSVNDDDHNRKPNTGMAMQAKEDFPEIDFRRSVMVGNSLSDMEFGKRLAMHTVFLTTKHEPFELPNDLVDEQYDLLATWAKTLAAAEMVG